ncbi:MAG: B12-binding domain-containing radical SAM protein [Deltaproteobacteria bacterium]
MMIDVLLVSSFFDTIKIAEPLGLGYLAAAIRDAELSVEIIEPSIEGLSIQQTIEYVKNVQPQIIGISIHRDENIEKAKEFARCLKEANYKGFICAGGHGPSVGIANSPIKYKPIAKFIDCFIIGEGELSMVELAKKVIEKAEWNKVKGIAYLDSNNEFIINPTNEKIKDLDQIPFMSRDILEKLIHKYGESIPASILFSRGCAYNKCRYCTVVAYEELQEGHCYRQRSITNVVEEIKLLHYKYGITEFNFEDDNFILPGSIGKRRIEEFCELIEGLDFKIKFTFFCRIDFVEKELFARLNNAGLTGLYIGIESINEETLKFFSKGLSKKTINDGLKILFDLGFSTDLESNKRIMVGYICWHPLVTINELKQTSEFVKAYKIPPKILRRKLHIYIGSKIIQDLDKMGLLDSNERFGWRYKEPQMKQMEMLIRGFIDYVNETRDVIRSIEKAITRFNKYPELKEPMKKFRKFMDNCCFTYFDGIVEFAEKKYNNQNFENELNYFDKIMRYDFHKYIDDNEIKLMISESLRLLDLPENTVDIFRK